MFYSEAILARRGPLAKVWLAAHMERKLSKSQTLQTDIEQSVDAIMAQEIEKMAIRLSGQLLLGVVRIYSRKAKYLLDDCNEALLKIKMAFRPGVVDLTEDQLTVNKTAITLQTNGLGLDLLLPDVDWDMDFEDRPLQRQGHHQAHVDDITLRTADDFEFGMNDPFDIGPSDGIGSQDFNDVDLGIHWGDEQQNDKSDAMSIQGSIGVGRDIQHHEEELDLFGGNDFNADLDRMSHRSKSRDVSVQPFGGMDIDLPDLDLGDLGIGFDDPPPADINGRTPSETRSLSRASSPLTEVPPTPPPFEGLDDAEIVDNAENVVNESTTDKPKRKIKDKRQIIDSVTELQNSQGASNRGRAGGNTNPLNTDTTSITSTHHFLPRSSIVMRLLEIRDDPVSYFLPTHIKAQGTFLSGAPPGLTPELADLFIRPVYNSTHKRKASPQESPSKKARREDVEMPRRVGSVAPEEETIQIDNSALDIDAGFEFADQSGAPEDYQLDFPEIGQELDQERAKSVFSERSRLSSVAPEGLDDINPTHVDVDCPVSIFDATQPSQSQLPEAEQEQPEVVEVTDRQGYSKNTVKALGLIRKELQPEEEDDASKTMSFKQMSNKASKRAAASFFFELLVLGTRDCVKLSQPKPFADITISAKPRLWEQNQNVGDSVPE
ncbi:Cohesin subunit rad21 [Psilocybe cubensis]|uniref:Cohesin subunit rad21 n=2 Tax=Psilocybe cubensis TaxID=181762 RepID=A0A8H7Y7U2_PSICU|nr:Cohesin subunit rad21 [Psilocybe cubensis]KAH9485323.1 Cohesin subunit rad21 [Psilocybe cubensis]